MSHYTVLVALPPSAALDLAPAIDRALEPFDENRELDPWDEAVDRNELHYTVAHALERGILTAPVDIAPVAPAGPDRSEEAARAHYAYIGQIIDRLDVETLAELLNAGNGPRTWPAKVVDGQLLRATTRNPDGYWDWWSLGGRWTGFLTGVEVSGDELASIDPGEPARDTIRRDALDLAAREAAGTLPITAALLDLDGRWHQPARVGWFGSTFDETMDEETWKREWRRRIEEMPPDTILALIDCHT